MKTTVTVFPSIPSEKTWQSDDLYRPESADTGVYESSGTDPVYAIVLGTSSASRTVLYVSLRSHYVVKLVASFKWRRSSKQIHITFGGPE